MSRLYARNAVQMRAVSNAGSGQSVIALPVKQEVGALVHVRPHGHKAESFRRHDVERALLSADLETELSVFFQPIIDLPTDSIVSFETLARWESPKLGPVSPGDFIPAAESCGLINELTRNLLDRALSVAAGWPDRIKLSFNLSAQDISTSTGGLGLIAQIMESGTDPGKIVFEITETATIHDFDRASAAIRAFKALGIGISLDDFGTGFSSLSHLQRLPLNQIKIDRSFVSNIEGSPVNRMIVKSLITLCADLNLGCVAEGVETTTQLEVLRELGCPRAQGYYFGHPMSEEDTAMLIRTERSAKQYKEYA
ncbi:MAG: putative bifunctional diguanylate cyclase/phosphodiesterase [Phyllobacterium sp.]